jgi:protein ImuA
MRFSESPSPALHTGYSPPSDGGSGGDAFTLAPGQVLLRGKVHEFYASAAARGAATGLVAAAAIGLSANRRPVFWIEQSPQSGPVATLHGAGWSALGGDPDQCIFVRAPDPRQLIILTADILKNSPDAVLITQVIGRWAELDLTASRRLSLAAERSGATLLLLRIAAEPVPSSAQTRWHVLPAPSMPLPGNAPGHPCFDIELLRQRGGPAGQCWRVEWDCEQQSFRQPALSGAVVPLSVGGTLGSNILPLTRDAA